MRSNELNIFNTEKKSIKLSYQNRKENNSYINYLKHSDHDKIRYAKFFLNQGHLSFEDIQL